MTQGEIKMRNKIYGFLTMAFLAVFIGNVNEAAAQVRAYRVTDAQVQTLLNRLETRTDAFRREIDRALDNSNRDGTRYEENVAEFVTDFENATDNLRNNFASRRSTTQDVEEVLSRAVFINDFMRNNRLTIAAQNQWNLIRNDLNTLSGYYRVTWTWNGRNTTSMPVASSRPYTVTDTQLQTLLARIEQRTDAFRRDVDRSFDNSRRNGTRTEDNITQFIADFENATDSLRRNFDERDSVSRDVEEVLSRASAIDAYIRNNRQPVAIERQWNLLRSDLSTLANYYRVRWDWNNTTFQAGGSALDTRLTGTYKLNVGQSDNVNDVIDRAITSGRFNVNQRDRIQRNLERRLTPPDMLAIEKRGQQVMLASTMSQQISLSADNVSRSETNANGRTVQTRVSSTNNEVAINYEGDRTNDFYVSFTPVANGQLRVTRRVYLENSNTTVSATSVYDKTDSIARWSEVNNGNINNAGMGGSINNGSVNSGNVNDFVVPNNTKITATLRNMIDTKVTQNNDRFQLEVTSPSQFSGAIIEGRIVNAEQSGRVSGRANLSMEFDTIRLRNGQTYRFAGFIDSLRAANGDNVQINNEGTVRDSNQTTRTVTRAGIGAALGAIIGAIAGGGQGAAIGAVVGAGAGAGTVVLQGRDNIELGQGSEFMITASAPNSVR
jgi:hypothetical protein